MSVVELVFPELPEPGDIPLRLDADGRRALEAELAEQLRDAELVMRRAEARIVEVLDRADRLGVFSIDGHRSIRSWAAATVNWSNRESRERTRSVHLCRDLPQVAGDLADGVMGVAALRELARLRANPRCGDRLVDAADDLVALAETLPFEDFRVVTARWEQFADADGAHRSQEAAHEGRHVRATTIGDTFHLAAQFGAVHGAAIAEILRRYEQAEYDTDWQQLKALRGDDGEINTMMLPRTHSQRRADALYAIFTAAASTPADSQAPEPVVNILIDHQTFEAHLHAAVTGEPAAPFDPTDLTRRCETDSAVAVDPAHAVAAATVGHVRRVVINSASVIIDLGRKQRCFKGSARTAAFLQDGRRCIWPGCGRTSGIQIDHTTEYQHLGVTATHNSDPLCNHHNPFKSSGYRLHRDPHGHWHTHRPDGTEIHPM